MARGRLILRTLGSSRKFSDARTIGGKVGEFAQTLYMLLVTTTDDYGRQAGDAFTVKHAVFPTSPRRQEEFEAALNALHESGLIVRYQADGKQVIQIVEFGKGQPNLHKRSPSHFPEFSGGIPESPEQLNGIEENLTELKRTEPKRTAPAGAGLDGFDAFWEIYPKKKSRADAERAWRKLAPSPELSRRIQAAVAAQRVTPDWQKDGGQFVPYPATWLNGRRWEDETRPVSLKAEQVYWADECAEIHGGTCSKQWDHEMKKRAAS